MLTLALATPENVMYIIVCVFEMCVIFFFVCRLVQNLRQYEKPNRVYTGRRRSHAVPQLPEAFYIYVCT